MKRAILAVALTFALAGPAFAFEGNPPPGGQYPNFGQRKADMLEKYDERIKSLQEEKACIESATNPDEVKACWEKFKAERKARMDEMKARRGQGGSGGQPPQQPPR